MNPPEIENILRTAPQPIPPADLLPRLLAEAKVPRPRLTAVTDLGTTWPRSWLAHWWPALVPAALSLVCLMVLAVQQIEINDLNESLGTLRSQPPASAAPAPAPAGTAPEAAQLAESEQQELQRLRALVAKLSDEVGRLEKMRQEIETLRRSPPKDAMLAAAQEAAPLDEDALTVQCMNNLKQIGLAMKMWALDNNGPTPPDMLSLSNYLGTPKILVCPSDTAHKVVPGWNTFTSANCSYEYLAPGSSDRDEPMRVATRCPVHGSVGLLDGSVQKEVGKNHPELLIQRDGKLFFKGAWPTPR